MTRRDRFFLVIQRTASVLVILLVGFLLAMAGWQWIEMRGYEREFGGGPAPGSRFARTLPYVGEQIETADGSLIAVYQEDPESGERVELGGITVTNPATGKSVVIAPGGAANVISFELIFERGDEGKAIGYLATTATREQYKEGRMDLVVGAFPAMTRHVAARGIRFSDLPQVRGDGSVGLLMWPEEGDAQLVAIRLEDGAIVERAQVELPVLKENTLSQGSGGSDAAHGAAPASRYREW